MAHLGALIVKKEPAIYTTSTFTNDVSVMTIYSRAGETRAIASASVIITTRR